MKKMNQIISVITVFLLAANASAADVTLVDNKPMHAVAGTADWFEYTVNNLEAGDSYNVIFNNGGWANGQTTDLFVESAASICLSSAGTDGAIYEIDCPTTDILEAEEEITFYTQEGRIKGYYEGEIAIYTVSGTPVVQFTASGVFQTDILPAGIYIIKTLNSASKVFCF